VLHRAAPKLSGTAGSFSTLAASNTAAHGIALTIPKCRHLATNPCAALSTSTPFPPNAPLSFISRNTRNAVSHMLITDCTRLASH
jgi:hypothetical protein